MEAQQLAVVAAGVAGWLLLDSSDEEYDFETGKRKKQPKRVWRRSWLGERTNNETNTEYKLLKELECSDIKEFANVIRMPPEAFHYILDGIRENITKKDTRFRKAITADERLSMTLSYLATGVTQSKLGRDYLASRCGMSAILMETCDAIVDVFAQTYLKTPSNPAEWKEISDFFMARWNYPGCCGAVDGKHIRIKKPYSSGSYFHNYKSYFSIILLIIADGNYQIRYTNIGAPGHVNDSSIWSSSDFLKAVDEGAITYPNDYNLPDCETPIKYHMVGDDAFALKPRMMKPYGHRSLTTTEATFNYRLSRARRVVENVFGILSSKFRVFKTEIQLQPKRAMKIVMASCVLHNILRAKYATQYTPPGSVDQDDVNHNVQPGEWRRAKEGLGLDDLEATSARNASHEAKNMRDALAESFMTSNKLPWQDAKVINTYDKFVKLN